jgi:hypothetical protein
MIQQASHPTIPHPVRWKHSCVQTLQEQQTMSRRRCSHSAGLGVRISSATLGVEGYSGAALAATGVIEMQR